MKPQKESEINIPYAKLFSRNKADLGGKSDFIVVFQAVQIERLTRELQHLKFLHQYSQKRDAMLKWYQQELEKMSMKYKVLYQENQQIKKAFLKEQIESSNKIQRLQNENNQLIKIKQNMESNPTIQKKQLFKKLQLLQKNFHNASQRTKQLQSQLKSQRGFKQMLQMKVTSKQNQTNYKQQQQSLLLKIEILRKINKTINEQKVYYEGLLIKAKDTIKHMNLFQSYNKLGGFISIFNNEVQKIQDQYLNEAKRSEQKLIQNGQGMEQLNRLRQNQLLRRDFLTTKLQILQEITQNLLQNHQF